MDTKSLINKSMRRSRSLPFTAFLLILAAGLLISQSRDNDGANKKTDVALLNKIVTLTQQLEIESLRGVEYFNSSAYDSLVKSIQNSDPAERLSADRLKAERLEARIREPNRKYFLTLLALREIYQDSLYSQMDTANNVYAQIDTTLKTGVIIDALNQAKYFNAWGLPHLYGREPSSSFPREAPVAAIVELGEPAIAVLGKLLFEKRNAPFWGSDEPAAGYHYQVNDYVVALIIEIEIASGLRERGLGSIISIKPDPLEARAERDSLIAECIKKYNVEKM